jgi:pimeloyl-ACP methyl ester carboxylesterase
MPSTGHRPGHLTEDGASGRGKTEDRRRRKETAVTADPTAPDTIVLIHGLWMTPLSWEDWVDRYTSRGYRVLAPSWPGLDMEIQQLRRDPSPIAPLTITEIVDYYEKIIRNLDRPPIIMGHSFGGGFTQVLLDHGLGAAGVAIDSAPSRGVLKVPWSTIRVGWPVVRNPANSHRAVGLTPKQFRYAFTNTLSNEESTKVYERYHVPGAGHVLFEGFLANLKPRSALRVDHRKRDRAPLLFIAGGLDHVVPAAVNRSNVKHYRKGKAIVEYKEFPGRSHYTLGQAGWEEVADYALRWATEKAVTDARGQSTPTPNQGTSVSGGIPTSTP